MRGRRFGPFVLMFAVASFVYAGAEPATVESSWGDGAFGASIGRPGLLVAHLGGRTEIFTGGSLATFGPSNYWYVLQRDATTGKLEPVYLSERMPASIQRMALGDLDGDQVFELVVGLENGEIRVYDAESRRFRYGFAAPLGLGLSALTLADLDADGQSEILITGGTGLTVYSGAGEVQWDSNATSGSDLVVGQMDDDPSLEIATSGGKVLDVETQAVQWNSGSFFGSLRAADIDGDGRDELVTTTFDGYHITIYDVETQAPKEETYLNEQPILALEIADADCDGSLEILIASGAFEQIEAVDPTTLLVKWALPHLAGGSAVLAVADVDGDSRPDILFESGSQSTSPDYFQVADGTTHTIKETGANLIGPFLGPIAGDVDGDGEPELVYASANADGPNDAGRIVVRDARTLRVRAVSAPDPSLRALHDIALANVDGDPALEILVGTSAFLGARIRGYDFDGSAGSLTPSWTTPTSIFGGAFSAVAVADVDLDGQLEIIGGEMRETTGADGTHLFVYPYPSGEYEWSSPGSLGPYWAIVRDVVVLSAGGGHPDLLAIVDGESLYGYDGVTKDPLPTIAGTFTVLRLDPFSAVRAIYLGDSGGSIYRYERGAVGYELTDTFPLGLGRIDGLTPLSTGGFLVASDGRLRFYPSLEAPPAWQSADYGAPFGRTVARGVGRHSRFFSGGLFGVHELAPRSDLLSVSPDSGPAAGGIAIQVAGSGFPPDAALAVGDADAQSVVVANPTLIEGTTPALPAGSLQPVTVHLPDGAYADIPEAFLVDFEDVGAGHPFHDAVAQIFRRHVTAGCGAGSYCAGSSVTRAQMAAFLVRASQGAAFRPPAARGVDFADVECGVFAADEIEWLAELGVTAGCGGGAYCGSGPVTRAQMAVFLLKALEGGAYVPPAAVGVFGDVPAADPFAPWIEELAARGITAGCGSGNYCPAASTTRGQMAAFLARTFFAP